MRSRQTNKPDKYIMSECAKVLHDELPYNLHIFVNSVELSQRSSTRSNSLPKPLNSLFDKWGE